MEEIMAGNRLQVNKRQNNNNKNKRKKKKSKLQGVQITAKKIMKEEKVKAVRGDDPLGKRACCV